MMMMMMMMHLKSAQGRAMFFCALSLVLALIMAFAADASPPTTLSNSLSKFNKMLHEKTAKEIKLNFKVLLTKMKVRQVPLAKARSEKLLAKLYREEFLLQEQIAALEQNLASVSDKQRRQSLRVIEVDKNPKEGQKGANGYRRNLLRVKELSQAQVEDWTLELKDKTRELDELRARIKESKNIIKHPDSYIAIPSNYGRSPPQEVRDREREVLIRDREIMEYRQNVEANEDEPPLFLIDSW